MNALDKLKDSLSGYKVSRYEHSLQSATHAYRNGEDEEMIVAALLHDIGDELAPWLAGIERVMAEEAVKRFEPINSISWMVVHLAAFKQFAWVIMAQNETISEAVKACAFGKLASTPAMDEMMADFHAIAKASDRYLDTLTEDDMDLFLQFRGKSARENIGTFLIHQTWHY